MFLRINKTTPLENIMSKVFALYRADILALHTKQWKEEDISGKSCIQYKIHQYYLATYYVTLIYLELQQGINTDWEYYKEKYKTDTIRKCLSCNNIDLNAILTLFGLPTTICEGGIECMGLEEDFEIEPETFTAPVYNNVDIKTLISNPISCELLLDSKCNDNESIDYILQLTQCPEFLIL